MMYVEIKNQIKHLRHRNASRISFNRYPLYAAATWTVVLAIRGDLTGYSFFEPYLALIVMSISWSHKAVFPPHNAS